MAYINPQAQIDQQQNERNDRNMAAIGGGLTNFANAFQENRRRAIDQARADKQQGKQDELYALQKTKAQHDADQLKLPYDQRDDYKSAAGLAALKQQGNDPSKDLALYEKKQEIKNRFKDNQNDESVSKAAQTKIVQNNVGLANVKSAMDSALKVLQDPAVPEDQKVKTGQGLFKLLNSAEGADAVGAEEAKRIGSYLEYNIGNFTQPGAFIGRDLKGFTDQIDNYSKLLGERVIRNEQTADGLKQGKKISETIQAVPHEVAQKVQSYTPEQKAMRLQQLRAKKAGLAMGGN